MGPLVYCLATQAHGQFNSNCQTKFPQNCVLSIVNNFNLLWSIISKLSTMFDPSAMDLVHVLVSRVASDFGEIIWLQVDGRQMVSLVSVHGKGSLFNIYSLLNFPLVPVGFTR